MSKYDRFEDFMLEVVNRADEKCKSRKGVSLNDLYKVKHANVLKIILVLISHGWTVFLAVVALLVLGPWAFGVSLAAFMTTPVGWVVAAALALLGGAAAIKALYQNRKLPLAIKETGEKYKARFKSNINNVTVVNSLLDDASDYLLKIAEDSLYS